MRTMAPVSGSAGVPEGPYLMASAAGLGYFHRDWKWAFRTPLAVQGYKQGAAMLAMEVRRQYFGCPTLCFVQVSVTRAMGHLRRGSVAFFECPQS